MNKQLGQAVNKKRMLHTTSLNEKKLQ